MSFIVSFLSCLLHFTLYFTVVIPLSVLVVVFNEHLKPRNKQSC